MFLRKKKNLFLMAGIILAIACRILIGKIAPDSPVQYLPQFMLMAVMIYLISYGADIMVEASVRMALILNIPNLIIGLTIVAFGTSMPEIVATVTAGIKGSGDIAIANIIGSNIFNLCFILGATAFIVGGLKIDWHLITRDAVALIAGTILLFLFVGGTHFLHPGQAGSSGFWGLLNLQLDWYEALILLLALMIYLYILYRAGKRDPNSVSLADQTNDVNIDEATSFTVIRDIALFILGIGIVVIGCNMLIGKIEGPLGRVEGYGALWLAYKLSIPDYIVGATLVAAGTSAPEFAVSLVAALKGRHNISTGNLLGSAIFNVLGVSGLAGLLLQPPLSHRIVISSEVVTSFLAMTVVIIITTIFMWSHRRLSRWEGAVLFALGLLYWLYDFLT